MSNQTPLQPTLVYYPTFEQVVIAGEAWGNPEHPAVLLLHGGGQTRHSWGETAKLLAEKGYYAVALDARGHGESSWSPDGQYKGKMVEDLLVLLTKHFPLKPAIVGASMGGITALVALGETTEPKASALILVDIAPRVEQKGVERIFAFMSANLDGFGSIEEAADAVANYLPHRPRPKTIDRLANNLRKKDDGRYYWHWDPKVLESWKNTTPEEREENTKRLYAAAQKLSMPTLIVRGGMSDVVSEKVMTEFLELVPHVKSVDVTNAGHMVAGDSNHSFTNAVVDFLNQVYPPKRINQ
ncbi:MAG TPA: alpha/beta hydrolase [Microscillaceae bacterium]|jgi:non-heme chloroperoxidase|nr:alpha/beta hydrolase [Microscillaceae bacterium]